MDATEVAQRLAVALEGAQIRGYVRRWLVATVGDEDGRVAKWDELVAAIAP